MLEVYYLKNKNSVGASHEYQSRYPDPRAPSRTYFSKLDEALRNFGRIDSVPKAAPSEGLETSILAEFTRKPESSSREVGEANVAKPHANVAELQSKVEEVLNNMDHSEIRRATRSVSRRCQICLDNA